MQGRNFDGKDGYLAEELSNSPGRYESLVAGDMDGDGKDEWAVGIRNIISANAGSIAVVWGSDKAFPPAYELPIFTADGCRGFYLQSGRCEGVTGFDLAIGNVDGGPGKNLIVFASSTCGDRSGTLYIFRGGIAYFASITLDAFTAAHGYKITGLPATIGKLFTANLNNHGPEEIVFANMENNRVYIIHGGSFQAVSSFSNINKTTIVPPPAHMPSANGGSAPLHFGSSVAATEMRGKPHLFVGAIGADGGNGAVYAYEMPANLPPTLGETDIRFRIQGGMDDSKILRYVGQYIAAGKMTLDGKAGIIMCSNPQIGTDPNNPFLYETHSFCAVVLEQAQFAPVINLTTLEHPYGFFVKPGGPLQQNGCFGKDGSVTFLPQAGGVPGHLVIGNPCAGEASFEGSFGPFYAYNGSVSVLYARNSSDYLPTYELNQLGSHGEHWAGTEYGSLGDAIAVGKFNGGAVGLAVTSPKAQNIRVALDPNIPQVNATGCAGVETPTPQTSAGTRPVPLMMEPLIVMGRIMNHHFKLPTRESFVNAVTHGGIKGAANVADYALSLNGVKQTARKVVTGAMYYGSVWAANYYNHYNNLEASSMPEAEKSTTAAYQATSDVATLFAVNAVSKAFGWLGGVAKSYGWERTGDACNQVSQVIGYGSYAYQSYQQGVAPTLINIGAGMVAEELVTNAGKAVVDSYAESINTSAMQKATKAKLTLFSNSVPRSQAGDELVMRASAGMR